MKILFLDTAYFFIYIAIIDNNNLLFLHQEKNDQKLSERIIELIAEIFQKSNTSPNEITKIYVTNGPGSFTGIRVGVTIAKTTAFGLNIPICSVSSLLMLASGFSKPVATIIPDRNGYGFCAFYNQNVITKNEEYAKISEFLKENQYPVVSYEAIKNQKTIAPIVDILRIVKKFKNQAENVHLVKANYIKKLDVEKTHKE